MDAKLKFLKPTSFQLSFYCSMKLALLVFEILEKIKWDNSKFFCVFCCHLTRNVMVTSFHWGTILLLRVVWDLGISQSLQHTHPAMHGNGGILAGLPGTLSDGEFISLWLTFISLLT